jgi:hypothetical protein
VSKNNAAKGLSQEITYLGKNQQTNYLVITVPYRFDLNSNSRENFEIGVYNRKLTKLVESLTKVVLVNSPMEREFVTRHGLLLNRKGKGKMVEKLAGAIHEIMEPVKKHSEAIPMPLNVTVPDQLNQEIETTKLNSHSSDGMKQSKVSPILGNDNVPVHLNKEIETIQINSIPTGDMKQDKDTRRRRRLPNRNEDFYGNNPKKKAPAKTTNKQVTKKNDDINNQIKIFHQNIWGIKGK